VDDACARLDTVSPALSSVLRRCCAKKAKERMSSDVALRALNEIDVGGGGYSGGGGSGGSGGGGGSATVTAPAAPVCVGAVSATSAVPAPAPATPPAAGTVQLIDIGDAADAVEAQQVPVDALNRVCAAMTLVADDDGKVTGAQLLRIVVDEGVTPVAALAIRRRLGITAPPRGVCSVGVVFCCCGERVTLVCCRGSRLAAADHQEGAAGD
jgi:hypothetical protein